MIKGFLLISLLLTCSFGLEGVQDLTDGNFQQLVKDDGSFWVVLFAADWCGHCQHLKPEFEKLAPKLDELGVKVGMVNGETNRKLVGEYVVDQQTHMVSYPKVFVFLGEETLGEVPGNFRKTDQMYYWFINEFGFNKPDETDL